MKPMARVLISRQRLYEKKCDGSQEESTIGNNNLACQTGDWSEWSECDTNCGKGKRHHQRDYLDPDAAARNNCRKKLSQRQDCQGAGTDCDEEEESNDPDNERVEPGCALTKWSEWSGCSAICGKGSRTKSRKFVNKKAKKPCMRGMTKPPLLELIEECFGEECSGDINAMSVVDNSNCKMSNWSSFTPCSVTCGLGKQIRTRILINRGYGVQRYGVHQSSPTYEKIYGVRNKINRNRNNNNDEEDDEDNENENEFDEFINDPTNPCYNASLKEEVTCGYGLPSCENSQLYTVPEFCLLQPKAGHCRVSSNRWFYINRNNNCSLFLYSGCGGNKNNFQSEEDCLSNCRKSSDFENFEIRDQHKFEEKTDCKVTNWVRGPCNVTCGSGFRTKTRSIVTHPLNGGRECPKKFKRFERCEVRCGPAYDTNPSWGPTTIQVADNCEYTNWGQWSPCSQTCGENAKQQRTRHVTDSEYALYCNDRVETRSCNAMPCRL